MSEEIEDKPLATETIMITTFDKEDYLTVKETHIYDNFDFEFVMNGEEVQFKPSIDLETPIGYFNMILEITDSPYTLRAGGMVSLGFYCHRIILYGVKKVVGENIYNIRAYKFTKHKEMRDL